MRQHSDLLNLATATLVVVLLAIAGSAPAGAEGQAASPLSVAVKVDNFTFGPSELVVSPGTTVTWTNRDDIPHTIVADDHSFKSKVLDTDDAFSYTFNKPGTYPYFCSIHPHMTGTVVVK